MTNRVRTLGLANGGGDAPGINAVIRAVVRSAIKTHGMRVLGIRNGFDGLIWPEQMQELTLESVHDILPRGGTILGTTNRGNPFAYKRREGGKEVVHDYSDLCLENVKRMGIDAFVVIGGDGTLHIARDFMRRGMKLVGVPKTIDNDLLCTEFTFGFDTALWIATEAFDRLRTTAESHHRVMILELMGREAGWIALHAGMAGGAHIILLPEIAFRYDAICKAIQERENQGKRYSIIAVAEGISLPPADPNGKPVAPAGPCGAGNALADVLRSLLQKEIRVTVLGHVQRGGSPSPFDRLLATRMGVKATDLVARGQFQQMVCLRAGEISSVGLEEALSKVKLVDPASEMVRAARATGIMFGDDA